MININRLINKNKLTAYGLAYLSRHSVIIDLHTGYINGTKFCKHFYTNTNKPKNISKWIARNATKIDNIRNHVRDELVDGDIMYTKNASTKPINKHVLKICSSNKPMSLTMYNNVFNARHVNFNCIIKGIYVHPILLLKIYMIFGKIETFNQDLLKWCIHYMLLFKFNLFTLKYDFMINDLLCDKVYTRHIHNNLHLYDMPRGHMPVMFKNNILSVLVIDNIIYIRHADVVNVMNIRDIPDKYIKSFKDIYDSIYYKTKHPLDIGNIHDSYIAYPHIRNKLSEEACTYFESVRDVFKNNKNALHAKISEMHISEYILPNDIHQVPGMYIIYIGIHDNEHLFKFGITRDIHRRLSEHKNVFGQYTLVDYIPTRRITDIERDFKNILMLSKVLRTCVINNKRHTELFTLTREYDINYILSTIRIISKRYTTNIDDLKYINELQRIVITKYT